MSDISNTIFKLLVEGFEASPSKKYQEEIDSFFTELTSI